MRKELIYVLSTFIGILLLPVVAVLVITNTGMEAVSETLIAVNPQTHHIEIHDPTGNVVTTLDAQTVWPLQGFVTLEFGESDLPYQPIHTGIDIATTYGTPVTSFMKGKVIYVGHLNWGYGNYISIDHGNNITSLYGHLSSVTATVGQEVTVGEVIGTEGSSGWSTGPHTHFEVRDYGVPVNPRTFIESR